MKISVIIPALNEEKYLPRILEDLKSQTFQDFEVIVADANSLDNTRKIAKEYGAKVVGGGSPARGRNNGAKVAEGDFFFFFDADVRLNKNFLEKTYQEMQSRFLDLATCEFVPISDFIIDKVMHGFANLYMKLSQFSDPHAPGCCIIAKRWLFERAGGFNENIKLAEDHDFVKRAAKLKPLRILQSEKIKVDVRRLNKEGRFELFKNYLKVEFYRSFIGEIDGDSIRYEFGNFEQNNEKKFERRLLFLDKQVSNLNKKIKKYLQADLTEAEIKLRIKSINIKFKAILNKIIKLFVD